MTVAGTSGGAPGAMRVRLRNAGVVIAAVLGVLLAFVLYKELRENETQEIKIKFTLDAAARMRAIERGLDRLLEALEAVRSFYDGSTNVERDEFRKFTAGALRRHGSIEALAWAPVVEGAERRNHEAVMRTKEGVAGYEIREPAPSTPSAAARARYVPFSFIEPEVGHERLFGVDLTRLTGVPGVLDRARSSGGLAAHPRVRLGVGDDDCCLFVVLAIYDRPAWETVDIASLHLKGYVVAAIRLRHVVETALQFRQEMETRLFAGGETGDLLYGDPLDQPLADLSYGATKRAADVELFGRFVPPRAYVSDQRTLAPLFMGLAVLVVVGVGVGYLYLLTRHTDRIERLVTVRTAMIREVSRLQQAILDGAPYMIVSTDPEGRIRTFNSAAERMLGYATDDVVGKTTPEIFHRPDELRAYASELRAEGVDVPDGLQAIVAPTAAGRVHAREWTFVRRDRTEFPVSLSVTALRDDAGDVVGFVGMAEDITDRKRGEAALVAAKTAAEEASQTKSRFLANMSHELRTPLNAIIGYGEMLEEDAVGAGKHEIAGDLRRITSAARHLLQLISDVLDLSKIEAGRIDIHNEPVALDRLIGEVTATVSQMIADNGNTLEATCDPAIGVMVTDPTRVRQILFNLLSNAAKFTTEGAVRVRAVLAPEPPAHVLITVEDTGIGMRPAQLERIFRPFAQADGSTTRKYGGTGLGLAICREFCRLMNGSIGVESEAGVGSTFTVRLPYHPGAEPAS